MIIKDKAYYERFNRDIELANLDVNYHIKQANNWTKMYRVTKDRRGYGWLNKFAKYMNKMHVRKGTNIAIEAMNSCEEEMVCLCKYISNKDGVV